MAPPSESQILYSYLLHPSPLPTILPFQTFQNLVSGHNSIRSSSSARSNSNPNPELKRLYRDLQFQRDITIDDVRRRIDDEVRRSAGLVAQLRHQVRREEGEGGDLSVRLNSKSGRGQKRKRDSVDGGDDVEKNESGNEDEDDSQSDSDSDSENEEQQSRNGNRNVTKIQQDTDSETDSNGGTGTNNKIESQIDHHLDGPRGQTRPARLTRPRHRHHTITSLFDVMDDARADLESEIAELEAQVENLRRTCEERVGALSDLRYGRFAGSSTGTGPGRREASSNSDHDSDKEGANAKASTNMATTTTTTVELEVVDALHDFTARLAGEMQKEQKSQK